MVWKYDANKKCRSQHGSLSNLPPFITCIKSHLQKNVRVIIRYDKEEKLDLTNDKIIFDYEDQEENDVDGYQLPCKGDSGAGHWVEQGMAHDKRWNRAVLVGIMTHGSGTNRCGIYAHMQKTIDSVIHHFIKEMAKL